MSSKARIVIRSIMVLALAAVWSYMIFLAFSSDRQAAETYGEAEALSGNDAWTRSVKAVMEGSSADIASLQEAAITRSELISLIELLEETGRSMGLKVVFSSITDEKGAATSSPSSVKLVVDTEGPWSANLSFIKLLANLPVRSSIEEVSMNHFSSKVWRTGATFKITTFPEI